MRKVFVFLIVCAFVLFVNDYALALASLTNCSMYQLGSNEFVLKLYGKNIPVPEEKITSEDFCIVIHDTTAKNPDAINSQIADRANTIPLINSLTLENISGDKISITIKSNSPLKISNASRAPDGYIFRIAAEIQEQNNFSFPPKPPSKPKINFPNNSLPFTADKKITLEFRDVPLRDVLRMFMADIGKNIIIDSSFPSADVTMTLDNVRTDEITNYFLRAYDISCYMSGKNTITFGRRERLYKLSGEKSIKPFRIYYAEISKVKDILKNLAPISDDEIALDERTRTLYVNTNPAKMERVSEIISELDTPMKQVMIHASIFEFSDTAARDVENALNIVYDEWQNVNISPRSGVYVHYNDLLRKSINVERTITGTFSDLERKNKGKILANPSVIAIDGQEATIKLTQDYAYVSGKDEAGNTETEIEEVGPKLTFTPRIERDGYLRLKINIKTGDVIDRVTSGNAENLPITSNREVTTEIRVRDGMPFVIGGLFQDNQTNITSRIPIIGSIPLLGKFFTYKSAQHEKTQAVMIVTPYILDM